MLRPGGGVGAGVLDNWSYKIVQEFCSGERSHRQLGETTYCWQPPLHRVLYTLPMTPDLTCPTSQ